VRDARHRDDAVVPEPVAARRGPRVRLHCRFRNRGTEYVSDTRMKWMNGRKK
jgi:hypothetical protein